MRYEFNVQFLMHMHDRQFEDSFLSYRFIIISILVEAPSVFKAQLMCYLCWQCLCLKRHNLSLLESQKRRWLQYTFERKLEK